MTLTPVLLLLLLLGILRSGEALAIPARIPTPIALVTMQEGTPPLVFDSLPVPLHRVLLAEEGGAEVWKMGAAIEEDRVWCRRNANVC